MKSEGIAMKFVLELIAYICLDGAMAVLLCNEVSKRGRYIPHIHELTGTFGVGFALGIVANIIRGNNLFIVLTILGFYLAYNTFVFAFMKQKKAEGVRG